MVPLGASGHGIETLEGVVIQNLTFEEPNSIGGLDWHEDFGKLGQFVSGETALCHNFATQLRISGLQYFPNPKIAPVHARSGIGILTGTTRPFC